MSPDDWAAWFYILLAGCAAGWLVVVVVAIIVRRFDGDAYYPDWAS